MQTAKFTQLPRLDVERNDAALTTAAVKSCVVQTLWTRRLLATSLVYGSRIHMLPACQSGKLETPMPSAERQVRSTAENH